MSSTANEILHEKLITEFEMTYSKEELQKLYTEYFRQDSEISFEDFVDYVFEEFKEQRLN